MSHHSLVKSNSNGKSSPHVATPDPKRVLHKTSQSSSNLDPDTHDGSAPSVDVQMAHALQFGHSLSKSLQQKAEDDDPELHPSIQRQTTSGTDEDEDDGNGPDLSLKQEDETETLYSKINVGTLMRRYEMAQRAQLEQEEQQPRIQPKLTVGRPGDRYEQEADRTAAQVMAMPNAIASDPYGLMPKPGLQRQQDDEEPTVHPKPLIRVQAFLQPSPEDGQGDPIRPKPLIQLRAEPLAAPDNFETDLGKHRGGGSPLSDETRSFMEPRFGADFSGVRIHQAPKEAGAIGAQAFTHGQDIYFNSGKYNPGSSGGKELLAHELTHTIQQTGGKIRRKSNKIHLKLGSAPAEALADEQQTLDTPTSDVPATEPTQASAPATVEQSTQPQQQSQPAESQQQPESTQSAPPIESRGATDANQGGENSVSAAIAPVEAPPTETAETPAEQESKNPEKENAEPSQSGQSGSDSAETPPSSGSAGAGASGMGAGGTTTSEQSPVSSGTPTETNQLASASANALGAAPEPLPQGDMAAAGQGDPGAATANVAMPPVSPEQDPDFQAAVAQSEGAATTSQRHAPAATESQAAQAAAQSPANEVESQAQDQQVADMAQEEGGTFDAASFKQAVMDKVDKAAPQNLDQADKFKDNGLLGQIKDTLSGEAKTAGESAAAPIADKADEDPNTSGITPRESTPLEAPDMGAAPTINAGAAKPKPKPDAVVAAPMEAQSQNLDQQMASADVTEEQLANSNEPQFTGALSAKQDAQTKAVEAPQAYRQQEQATLGTAQAEAQTIGQTASTGMHSQREAAMGQLQGLQEGTKSKDEQKRSEVASHIDGIYQSTQSSVDGILGGLENEVMTRFNAGADRAKKAYEDYVKQPMEEYKKRYDGLMGAGRWLKDKLLGVPSEVTKFFQEGRQKYLNEISTTLDAIAEYVTNQLNQAKEKIKEGRQKIQDYVAGLPTSLQQVGQEAASNIQSKFDALEQSVDDKHGQLIDSLAQAYTKNLEALDAQIEEMKASNQPWFAKALDSLTGVIETINKLKNMLMTVLAKVADTVGNIIKDPIGFLSNLVSGITQGLQNFLGNIWEHLQGGLIGWLTGALGPMGITIPDDLFSLPGIFDLVTQILGLTWDYIRGKAVKMFGEPVVAGMEKTVEIIQVVREKGFEGLWEQVQQDFTDLQATVMDQIKNMVITQVITAGVKWIIGLLNPASAFVKACMTIYQIVMFFVNQGSQVLELVNAVVEAVAAIASGAVGGAAKFIENALVKALPVVIGFLASLLGIGGLTKKVQGIIKKIRKRIDKAINKLLKKAKKLFKGKKGKDKDKEGQKDEDHTTLAKQAASELKNTEPKQEDYESTRKNQEIKAKQIENKYTKKLKDGIKLSVQFSDAEKDKKDNDIDFTVKISPNDTVINDSIPIEDSLKAAVKSKGILAFMKAMAAGQTVMNIDRQKLEELWKNQANKDWLKDRFRKANSGHHEWIPTNMILQVINRTAGVEEGVEVANWIDLQHELRTDTSWVVFKPSKGTTQRYKDKNFTILHGHIGAIYLNGKQKKKGERAFHQSLRDSFSSSKTSGQCIADLQSVFENWVWNGQENIFPPIHPQLQVHGIMAENNISNIKSTQSENFHKTKQLFSKLKGKYGS